MDSPLSARVYPFLRWRYTLSEMRTTEWKYHREPPTKAGYFHHLAPRRAEFNTFLDVVPAVSAAILSLMSYRLCLQQYSRRTGCVMSDFVRPAGHHEYRGWPTARRNAGKWIRPSHWWPRH